MKNTTEHTEEKQSAKENIKQAAQENVTNFWYHKQHKELLFYLSIAIFMLELVVGAVAFFYGIIHAEPGIDGGPPRFQFPWLGYALGAILAPAALLLIVHLAGVGLFRSLRGKRIEEDEAWQKELPERLRKVYAIIQGAPTAVLLVGILLLGVALFYVDGAIQMLLQMVSGLKAYLPWIIGGLILAWCVAYLGRTWFAYRTKHMQEEYAFRREVLERTGQIIVDKGSVQLPPAYMDAHALPALAEAEAHVVESVKDDATIDDATIIDHATIVDVPTDSENAPRSNTEESNTKN